MLHGGPGAPGDLASLARRLAERYTVLEPLQRRSGGAALTVARHVDDLEQLLAERCGDTRPIVLGHSWGAMLALAHGAAHPQRAAALVLVSCGTFDEASRVDLIADPTPLAGCDARGNSETWDDMMRCQAEGLYPAAFSAIEVPVLMLHGGEDAHPGAMIRASLAPHLPQLEFVEWPCCGHSPWLERALSERFFATLDDWIAPRFGGDSSDGSGPGSRAV